jgi:hypothetical protein
MPNITLVISEELKTEMDKHSSVKWSAAVRNIIEQKLMGFAEAEKLAKNSLFSLKDWKLLSKKISKRAAKHAEVLLSESNG